MRFRPARCTKDTPRTRPGRMRHTICTTEPMHSPLRSATAHARTEETASRRRPPQSRYDETKAPVLSAGRGMCGWKMTPAEARPAAFAVAMSARRLPEPYCRFSTTRCPPSRHRDGERQKPDSAPAATHRRRWDRGAHPAQRHCDLEQMDTVIRRHIKPVEFSGYCSDQKASSDLRGGAIWGSCRVFDAVAGASFRPSVGLRPVGAKDPRGRKSSDVASACGTAPIVIRRAPRR